VVHEQGASVSGHSKWHSIKHAKGAADAARGKQFARLARQIEVAARDGGGDIDGNPTLRTMVQKARDASMPKDNIERAIKRGTGELEGVTYESVTYEGYATNGVAVYVEALTDNRNRTGAEVKNVFTRNGGSLAEPGAVAWQFERKGVLVVAKSAASEDDVMLAALDAGAEDIADQGDTWQVVTPPTELHVVGGALAEAGITVTSADLTMLPSTSIALADASSAKSVLRVIDALEEHDDVQNVYANFDIPDDVLQAVYA
jgi:YebC/PmpR family DNA-binding regulatory protein